MSRYKDLDLLFSNKAEDLPPWAIGKIPKHYKRITVTPDEAHELATLGLSIVGAFFPVKLFYTQALIAGAIFSNRFKKITVVCCSQYGKSWLLSMVGLIEAYRGRPIYLAAVNTDKARIIMNYVSRYALQDSAPEIRNALENTDDQLKKVATSVTKMGISFSTGGSIEAVTLGDTYQSVDKNMMVGKAGDVFLDEASLVSDDTYAETGRREFAQLGGQSYKLVQISNPHRPGRFYDDLTCEDAEDDHFIIWMDALTAVEEERFDIDTILNSEFAKNKSTRRRYLLCELDYDGDSMFDIPKTYEGEASGLRQHFLGVDAAYKGKDDIFVSDVSLDEDGIVRVEKLHKIDKGEWIDGVTSDDIVKQVARYARGYGAGMVCVDVGWGVWLTEGLRSPKYAVPALGINFNQSPTKSRVRANEYSATNASNKRAEMHLDLQNLIEDGKVIFAKDVWDEVKEAWPFITCKRTNAGKIRIREKKEIKASIGRSPDALDSILLGVQALIQSVGETYEFIA